MEFFVRELDSGMALAFKKIESPVAYCSLTIKAGTRDEPPAFNGLAHLTEHMLFKGTKKRTPKSINTCLERLGGELNAYTAKEETVVHATFLKEDLRSALELFSDILFNSQFSEKELKKEKEVILEEISSYEDTPSEQILDDFEEMLFGSHPLSKSILGRAETIRAIKQKELLNFVANLYNPASMVLSVVGGFQEEKLFKLANRYFGKELQNGKVKLQDVDNNSFYQTSKSVNINLELSKEHTKEILIPKEKRVARKTYQSHAVIGVALPDYSLYSPKRYAAVLLTNFLGGPALNSKLNTLLRERHGLVYNVEANYSPFSDLGLFTIYFGTENNNLDRCLLLLKRELATLCKKELSPRTLQSAKRQLIGQLAIASDNAEVQALSMGKSQLFLGRIESDAELKEKIEQIDSATLLTVAQELLNWDNFSKLFYQ